MSSISPLRAFGTHRVHHPFEGKIDTRRRRKMKDVARELPRVPGVYFFFGHKDRLLYIGKAKCLRERVASYFGETKLKRPAKMRRLLAEIQRLEWQECGSELEALLVERRLIAERRPLLNRQHKRFDVYPYLLLSSEDFPRLTLTKAEPVQAEIGEPGTGFRAMAPKSDLRPLNPDTLPLETPPRPGDLPGLYLGPFTTPHIAWGTLEAVRALFPLRSCEGDLKPNPSGRACFYHDIGRCLGPCVGAVTPEDYAAVCADLVRLLQTGQAPQLDALKARMMQLAAEWRFEEAARIKEQLQDIEVVAARLRRLQRMRETNNVVIAQRARSAPDAPLQASVFLVQGGAVRRHLLIGNTPDEMLLLKHTARDLYSAPAVAEFTAKTELDEMMILDRWLQAHGKEVCCTWMNERPSRQWAANVVRRLQLWMRDEGAKHSIGT